MMDLREGLGLCEQSISPSARTLPGSLALSLERKDRRKEKKKEMYELERWLLHQNSSDSKVRGICGNAGQPASYD